MAKIVALGAALAGWAALAQDGGSAPKKRTGVVSLRLEQANVHPASDLRRLARAGVRVEFAVSGKEGPSAYDLRDLLDDGVNVTIESDSYDAYDLRRLGGRAGRATVIISTRKYLSYELRWMVEEGIDLEIRAGHFSVYDLERIAGR